jgi:hypothetical protein
VGDHHDTTTTGDPERVDTTELRQVIALILASRYVVGQIPGQAPTPADVATADEITTAVVDSVARDLVARVAAAYERDAFITWLAAQDPEDVQFNSPRRTALNCARDALGIPRA